MGGWRIFSILLLIVLVFAASAAEARSRHHVRHAHHARGYQVASLGVFAGAVSNDLVRASSGVRVRVNP